MQRFPGGSLGTPLRPYHPVTGGLLGKTGLIGQRVVGEDRVVPRGAGAVGVLTGGGVLLKGHSQVQVLLSEGGTGDGRLEPESPSKTTPLSPKTHISLPASL